ncbi:MAG: DUF5320 domain-containing protein [Desulfobacterales bacterium]|nr:DUF5320 domain-containing protein [Desulfobacterales bacterium]
MPGMNQQGPMNQGPMTGRGQGMCNGNSMGSGMGRRGGRGCGQGRRCGNGNGMGRGYAGPVNREDVLQDRARVLKAELDRINRELDGAGDPEN